MAGPGEVADLAVRPVSFQGEGLEKQEVEAVGLQPF